MTCKLGRKTIFKPLLKILSVVYGGILGNLSKDTCDLLMGKITKLFSNGEIDVAYFSHLKTDSFFYEYTRRKTNILYRSHSPKIVPQRYMLIPQSFDQFLDACSRNSRRNYRRWTKKFKNNFTNRFEIKTYSDENEVDSALEQMARISAQTYQRAYGGGIVNDTTTQILFHNAAKKEWLRTYILSIENEPCAFWTGLKYGRIFYAETTGYLPKWRNYHIGTILFFKLVRDLCKDPDVNIIDFSFGEGQHKHWGESRFHLQTSVYIFAPRLIPVLIKLMLSLTMTISRSIEYTITKLGLFDHIQKYRRHLMMLKSRSIGYNRKLP